MNGHWFLYKKEYYEKKFWFQKHTNSKYLEFV